MKSLKLILLSVWIVGCACFTIDGQVDPNTQSNIISERITVLQSVRQAGLPETIESSSSIYLDILKLGAVKANTQQAANELIEWLFVKQNRNYTTEKFSLIHIHPAARALIDIGTDAIIPLKSKLTGNISNDDAVLVLRCLQHIYKNDSTAQLQQIKAQTTSPVVKGAVDFVLGEPSETTPTQSKLEPES